MTQKWLHSHPARGENHLPIGRSQPGSVNSPCPDAFLTATSGFSASWIGANSPGAASGGRVAAVPSLPSVRIPRTDRTPFPDSHSAPRTGTQASCFPCVQPPVHLTVPLSALLLSPLSLLSFCLHSGPMSFINSTFPPSSINLLFYFDKEKRLIQQRSSRIK